MKHLKLFENQSVSAIRNALKIYQSFIITIKPVVFDKFNELVDKRNAYLEGEEVEYVEPEYGDIPDEYAKDDFFYISDITDLDDGFEFFLTETDKHGSIEGIYQICLTDEEIKNAYIKLDANKYNL